ncbi:hypothetical protein B5G52_05110 [Pseudoalteromonas sp. A601]|uniref:HNH endonuclease n=1 Tax=Pseudoalteromonas sp. A601 TaxID=1967839 RepID=UPI000B3C2772|nr:HNH endonuclease signature motif containing protein [Pseudoalteromonas sp. A601]OUS73090.1 hypothetical protein B5G52_05110 [Pseudoalteromonas sp. A601]
MIKLDLKKIDMEYTFNACADGITDKKEQKRYNQSLPELINLADEYVDLGEQGLLYKIPALSKENSDKPVVGSIHSDELKELYNYYMVKRPVGRKAYDKIMATAQERCPFCGGIGNPRNLDHYLPKKHFPLFSITPHNLIPSCRDCNMDGKGTRYAKQLEKQIIHPYLDNFIFFNSQWVFAEYKEGQPGEINYYVSAPEQWGEHDKSRVEEHFRAFELARIYGRVASSHLGELLPQLNSMSEQFPDEPELIARILLKPVIESIEFKNHWKRVMYQAIIKNLQI